ncbi:NUT family member 2G-like [Lepus europaeus]|uniref:NUT family member 2G-like n=1 Tax=Lepus europaeus TaxID=9983 RepID=UPI002B469CDC|nr:NUT family member 2G-like [Lepus europaeus]
MTLHPGTSTFPLIPPPCPHTTLGPATQTPWGQPPPCLLNAVFPPGSQLVLPAALPRMPMVAGDGGSGPSEAGNFSVISPAAADGRPVQPPHSEPVLFNQAPLNWSAMGRLCEATQHPTTLLLPGSSVQKLVQPVPTTVHMQAGQGGCCPDLHPVGPPPPATQPAPVMLFPVHPGPEPPGGDPQCGTAASQAKASLKASRNPTSVYMNFRRWQRYKALAQRHCPQSPDAEALSCFLIPVLRTLAQRKPTMPLEEGLRFAMREWQHKSNCDRTIFYEMAEKFMEFEEEEMQTQKRTWMQGKLCKLPPGPLPLVPQGPPATVAVQQPGCGPRNASSKALPACTLPQRYWQPQGKVPKGMPTETVMEDVDIKDTPMRPDGPTEEDSFWSPREEGDYPDPELLSYVEKLISQEDFIAEVEAIIQPQFLEELLSPEPQLDLVALSMELEQEEGLTSGQVVQKTFWPVTVNGAAGVTPSQAAPVRHPSPESTACPGADRHDQGPQRCISSETCQQRASSQEPRRHVVPPKPLSRPTTAASFSGHRECLSLGTTRPTSILPRNKPAPRGPKAAWGFTVKSSTDGTRPAVGTAMEKDEELPSLDFFLDSQRHLLPLGLDQSPAEAPSCLGPQQLQRVPESLRYQGRGQTCAASTTAKSKKRGLRGSPGPAPKKTCSRPGRRVTEGQALALGFVAQAQAQKRTHGPLVTRRRKKQHRGQEGRQAHGSRPIHAA